MRKVLGMVLVLLIAAVPASAAVKMKVGPGFNLFSDSRVKGMSTAFEFAFDLDKFTAGYKVEQLNLTVTNSDLSTQNFRISGQITALTLNKELKVVADMPITLGLELGSLVTTGLTGTIAAPAAISQVAPVVGIMGGISYETTTKVPTSFNIGIGYRFADINDVATPFGGTTKNLEDLNAVRIEANVGLEF